MSKQSAKQKRINLKVAKGLRLRIAEDGNIYGSISSSSGEFFIAPEVLTLLTFLANCKNSLLVNDLPKLLKQNYQGLQANLPTNEECEQLLSDLLGAGVLVSDEVQSVKHMQNDGFGDPWAQWTMLADTPRCDAYYKALCEKVTEKTIVLDVGSGSGLLSAISLHLKAKKVIAIEETNAAKYIQPILQNLHLDTSKNRFILHNKNSFDVTLSEDISLIVSELFGNDPFQEGVIPTLREIAQKVSNQNINYIPEKLTVFAQIIDLKQHPAKNRIQSFQTLKREDNNFLSHFFESALNVLDLDEISFSLPLTGNDFTLTSQAVELGASALNPPPIYSKKYNPFFGKKEIHIEKNSSTSICIIWFRVHLLKDISISSLITEKDACDHWSPIVIPLKKSLHKNDKLEIKYELNDLENFLNCKIYKQKELIGSR